jgi:hypothetical protein
MQTEGSGLLSDDVLYNSVNVSYLTVQCHYDLFLGRMFSCEFTTNSPWTVELVRFCEKRIRAWGSLVFGPDFTIRQEPSCIHNPEE